MAHIVDMGTVAQSFHSEELTLPSPCTHNVIISCSAGKCGSDANLDLNCGGPSSFKFREDKLSEEERKRFMSGDISDVVELYIKQLDSMLSRHYDPSKVCLA